MWEEYRNGNECIPGNNCSLYLMDMLWCFWDLSMGKMNMLTKNCVLLFLLHTEILLLKHDLLGHVFHFSHNPLHLIKPPLKKSKVRKSMDMTVQQTWTVANKIQTSGLFFSHDKNTAIISMSAPPSHSSRYSAILIRHAYHVLCA